MVITELILVMISIRAEEKCYQNITTWIESGFEYISKDNQYYFTPIEYTFSSTISVAVNVCSLVCALDLFPFQRFKRWVRILLCYFQYFDIEEQAKKKLLYYAFIGHLV